MTSSLRSTAATTFSLPQGRTKRSASGSPSHHEPAVGVAPRKLRGPQRDGFEVVGRAVLKGVPACSAVGGTAGTEAERKRGKACAMLVCDGSKEGTVKTGNHAPPGGVRGGFLPTPSGLDKKTPPRKHSGKVRHNIGLIPENGQWAPTCMWLIASSRAARPAIRAERSIP